MQLTVQGTVEDFDQARFQASLGAYFKVSPADISLDVSAASVNVKATITFADASAAGSVVDAMQDLASNLTALSAAVGVTVEGASDPVVSQVVFLAPSPPPPSPPPSLPPPSPSPLACTSTFADKASLQTAVTEYNSNAAAATAKYGAIAGWCVSGVTDMSNLFSALYNINAEISGWDTSRVTNMNRMFYVCAPHAPPPDICSRTLSPLHAACTPRSRAASRLPGRTARTVARTASCALLATLGRTRGPSTSL